MKLRKFERFMDRVHYVAWATIIAFDVLWIALLAVKNNP